MDEHRPRLMLFTPPIADAAGFADRLRAALEGGELAALAFVLADADDRTLVNTVKMLAPLAQAKGAAVLVADRPGIVARGGADGAHLSEPGNLADAQEMLGSDRIVGVGGLRLRDDAMVAAERGVDYVLFGEKHADGSHPPLAAVIERAAWWAEIFETPCVAFAHSLETIPDLVATGVDFVALGDAVWTHGDGPAAAIDIASRHLAQRLVV